MALVRGAVVAIIAGLIGLAFAALHLGFIGLGSVDWNACFDDLIRVDDMPPAEQLRLFKKAALNHGLYQWPLFTRPSYAFWSALFLFIPPFALSVAAGTSRSVLRMSLFVLALVALFALMISSLLPVSAQHDCDRKGNNAEFQVIFYPLVASGFGYAAYRLSRVRWKLLWRKLGG